MDPITIAMLGTTALSGLSGLLGSKAAKKKKKAELAALEQSRADINQGYGQAEGVLKPGSNYQPGLDKLLALSGVSGPQQQQDAYGAFQTSPGYEFQKSQGLEALARQGAVSGQSGRTTADAMRFGTGLADQEFSDYFNRIHGLTQDQMGMARNLSDLYVNRGGALAGLSQRGGQIRSNAITQKNNAWTGAIQGISDSLGYGLGNMDGAKPPAAVDPTRSSYSSLYDWGP
jgi:hypothetical protein